MSSTTKSFDLQIDNNGIASLIFDCTNEKVNKLAIAIIEELDQVFKTIIHDPKIKILIFKSAKKDNFIAGADINEIKSITDEKIADQVLKKVHEIFNNLEKISIPTIALINGSCLGGGLELALTFKYRIAIINKKTIIGLPEVNLGIIPGFGGTQRLPNLIGLEESLKIILSGKPIDSLKAYKLGLVDQIIHEEFLENDLNKFINEILTNQSQNQYLLARKKAQKKRFVKESLLLKKYLIFYYTKKQLIEKTKCQYLAPFYALEVVKRTYRSTYGTRGFKVEREAFCELVVGEICKNLIEIFFTSEALKKDYRIDELKDYDIKNCGLLGAGIMGGGIAWLFANNDIKIRIKDITQNAIATGYNQILKIFNSLLKIKKLTPAQLNLKIANISTGLDYTGFNDTNLVIEAVVENMAIKKRTIEEVEKFVKSDTIIVSNTSSLSITEMSKSLQNPSRFAGMHFFNPVNRMPLVEIIRGERTDEKTIAKLVKIARKIGKTPIVVKDVSGFLVNRILLPYILEATYLAQQGAKIVEIDQVLEKFGMPMGPFILADTVGIDIGIKVMHSLQQAYLERMKISQFMLEFDNQKELLGKKTNKGFYLYSSDKSKAKPEYNSQIDDILEKVRKENNQKIIDISEDEIIERCMLVMINESAKCLDEQVVDNARYLDMAMILGAGFPAFRGGILRYADKIGINQIFNKLYDLEQKFGIRYRPAKLICEMARNNQNFYQ